MLSPTYLQVSRNGVYYLRWPMPRQLHTQRKPSTLKLSLGTRDPRRALRLSRSLIQLGEEIMETRATDMTYAELRELLKGHFQGLLERRREAIDTHGRLSAVDRDSLKNSAAFARQAMKRGNGLFPFESYDELLSRFMSLKGVSFAESSPQYAWLRDELKLFYREYAKSVLAYDDSLATAQLARGSSPLPQAKLISPASGMTLAELRSSYTREKQAGGIWVAKTKLEKADHLDLLEEILGSSFDVAKLTAADAKRVKDTLLRYPKNREKNPATRGKSLAAALDVTNVDTISTTTLNKYLSTYSDLFDWAFRNSHAPSNLFSGLTVQQSNKQAKGDRSGFTTEQIRLIIEASTQRDTVPDRLQYQKWGPLIGVYSGARLNEISQLHLKDIKQVEGVWCFDFNENDEDKHLKSDAATRIVPIHDDLIRVGLLDHVTALSGRGGVKLFPDFSYDAANGWG